MNTPPAPSFLQRGDGPWSRHEAEGHVLTVPTRKLIVTPEGASAPEPKPRRDETLVKALVRAHRWRRRIERGQAKSITC